MSRIYFHSEQEETEVYGAERAYMGKMISDIGVLPLLSMCKSWTSDPPKILKCIPEDHYLTRSYHKCPKDFSHTFETWFRTAYDGDDMLTVNGQKYHCFDLGLNTAMSLGSDPIKLYARIHGSCELHGYVEGQNRPWIASIIKNGLETSIYRKDRGWKSTIKMLESDDQSPVVMSYSVCDEFPDKSIAGYTDCNEDEWYDLSYHEQWEIGMKELRKTDWLELSPDAWDDYRFSFDMNSFMIVEHLCKGEQEQ